MIIRVDLPSLSTFVTALIQADKMGTSLGKVLRIQSTQMRIDRTQRAEKLANEAPVKMLFPLIACIFPTVFMVLFAPIVFAFMFGNAAGEPLAFKLTITRGYDQGRELVVGKDEATIGRTEDNDVVLTEIGVSRRHVHLFTRGGKAFAEDGGSHRTLLNDQPLSEPHELRSGDLLALGPVVLKVDLIEQAGAVSGE